MSDSAPINKPKLSYLYNYCQDIELMRQLYVEILGFSELSYTNTEEFGFLDVDAGGIEFMCFRVSETLPTRAFAKQPGDDLGDTYEASWSIDIAEDAYAETITKLQHANFKAMSKSPTWRQECYWGYTIMDPAGNTVEVYTTPKQTPQSTSWDD